MAAVKEALALATEVSTMLDCMNTEQFGSRETVIEFMDWAIDQHATHVANEFNIDKDGITGLLQWADDAIGEVDSLEMALPLFRYYLQAYKASHDLTAKQLDELAVFHKPRIQIIAAATYMASLNRWKPTAEQEAEHRANCVECQAR